MTFNQLKTGVKGMAAVVGFSILLTACNNNDESANNSTTATGDKVADTSGTAASDATVKAPKKKSGKITTAAMTADDPSIKIEKDKMGIYTRTEISPEYVGGQSSLQDYIVNNLQYPQDAIDNNVEGVVRVQFAVDEKGNVSNVSTLGNKLGYGLEEEAIKVVSSMPKWAPGKVKGKNVKTWRTLPINYQLES
ncbi:MAG: energy transducer TonB [Sphingobacteriales bacterium]|nr:MAG: energy transducer TonB [Sphingobacteriales bacterium]